MWLKILQVHLKKAYCVIKYSTKYGKMNMNKSILTRLSNTMSAETMYCPEETDKHEVLGECLSVSDGHYIVLEDINSK